MRRDRALWLILALGLALRLAVGVSADPLTPYANTGGDSGWYLLNGGALVTGRVPDGAAVDLSRLPTPPGYLLFVGVPQALFEPAGAVIAIRVVQALLSTLMCALAYDLARCISGQRAAGWIAALALALNPAFILEAAQITSETLYMTFVAAGLWAYVKSHLAKSEPRPLTPSPLRREGEFDGAGLSDEAAVSTQPSPPQLRGEQGEQPPPPPPLHCMERGTGGEALNQMRLGDESLSARMLIVSALFFGLATLTRAPLLLFPLGLALHLVLVDRRAAPRQIALLLLVYALTVGTWTAYNLARYGRFIIAGEGLPAFLYLGAAGWDDPQTVDRQLQQHADPDDPLNLTGSDFLTGAARLIGGDVGAYVARRVGELTGAVLQPHGTAYYPGESLREAALAWWRDDRSVDGLVALTEGDAFWQKLALYLFHYAALILGAVGMWTTRQRWRLTLPLIGLVGYVLLLHLVLLALPRYIFPTMIVWWVFAACAITRQLKPTNTG